MTNESEQINQERIARWEQIAEEVDAITDVLGHSIEDGIKPAVIALQALEFPTSQSCEGHVRTEEGEEQQGNAYPWVEIYAPEPEGIESEEEKERVWRTANLKLQRRMIEYLAQFYESRKSDFDARMGFRNIGMFGGFRIQSIGGEIMEILSLKEQQEKRELYKSEMDKFTAFLKEQYFAS